MILAGWAVGCPKIDIEFKSGHGADEDRELCAYVCARWLVFIVVKMENENVHLL